MMSSAVTQYGQLKLLIGVDKGVGGCGDGNKANTSQVSGAGKNQHDER